MTRTWSKVAPSVEDFARHAIAGLQRPFHPTHPGRGVLAGEMHASDRCRDTGHHRRHLARMEDGKCSPRPALERPLMRHALLELRSDLGERPGNHLDTEPHAYLRT